MMLLYVGEIHNNIIKITMKLKLKRSQLGLRHGNVALFKEIQALCGVQRLKLTGAAEIFLT